MPSVPDDPRFSHATRVLMAMQLLGYRMYEGTANPKRVAKRRAKNRVAKQSRKVNRGR